MDVALVWAFAACALGTLALLAASDHLPMADLPQHEAQVALWIRHGGEGPVYRTNWFTPYLLAYLLGRGLSLLLGVHEAMRWVVALSVIGLPASLWVLLREARGDRWWALAGFPLAFGVAFSWGLLNYLLALPLGVLFLAASLAYQREGTTRRAAWLAFAGCVAFACHPLVWGPCGLAALAILWGERPLSWRQRLLRALPLLASAALAAAWLASRALDPTHHHMRQQLFLWDLLRPRPFELPAYLLGPDPLAALALAVLLGGVLLGAGGLRRSPDRWGPAAAFLALFLLAPSKLKGVDFLFQRGAVLLPVGALLALNPTTSARRRSLGHGVLLLAALAWLGVLSQRFGRFQTAAAGAAEVTATLPHRARVLSLVMDSHVEPLPGSPLLHLGMLAQLEHDVIVEPSFARNFQQLMLYRPDTQPPFPDDLDAENPDPDIVERELARAGYDHVVVRARDPLSRLPVLASWVEVASRGEWHLFRRKD